MHNARLVSGTYRLGYLHRNRKRLVQSQGFSRHTFGQRLAWDVFKHQKSLTIRRLDDVMNYTDIGMTQGG